MNVDLHVGEAAKEHVWPLQLQLAWDRIHTRADVGNQLLEVGERGGRILGRPGAHEDHQSSVARGTDEVVRHFDL